MAKNYIVTYDLDNRMTRVKVNRRKVNYRYDALGRRVIRQFRNEHSALIWWGNSENAEYNHRGSKTSIQNDIMSHPTRLNSVIARVKEGKRGRMQWYHKNYLDHVYAVSTVRGKFIEHYRYSAFGEVEIFTGTGRKLDSSRINNQITWNTRRLDEISGYYLYKYRHYDPQLGRWPSRDPIEERGGVNLYAFVGNDPIVEWDIYGLAEHWEVTLWECKCLARCSLYSSDPDVECPEEAMAIKTKWTDKLYTFPI